MLDLLLGGATLAASGGLVGLGWKCRQLLTTNSRLVAEVERLEEEVVRKEGVIQRKHELLKKKDGLIRRKETVIRAEKRRRQFAQANLQKATWEHGKTLAAKRDVGMWLYTEVEADEGFFRSSYLVSWRMQLLVDRLPVGAATTLRQQKLARVNEGNVNKVLDEFAKPLLEMIPTAISYLAA
jgi:hypothetical protein